MATARASRNLSSLMICSTIATTSLEDIAGAAPGGHRWFQLYVYKDREETIKLIRRAETAGYKALVLTVDTPVVGKRRDDLRNGYSLPSHLRMANFPAEDEKATGMKSTKSGSSGFSEYAKKMFDPSLTWADVTWMTQVTSLPVVVKGVLTKEDALLAYRSGASGILVSNHGARQLDSCPATIEALPEIANAVGDKCEVYMDGGVRTGADVFKALALGARAVFVGRPILWGLAQSGQNGVENVLRIFAEELDVTMALSGCRNLKEIRDENAVVHETFYRQSKL